VSRKAEIRGGVYRTSLFREKAEDLGSCACDVLVDMGGRSALDSKFLPGSK